MSSTPHFALQNSLELAPITKEQLAREWCSLHCLIQELSVAQSRLGTPLETPADYDAVRDLGHRIRNKLHLVQMWAELGLIDPGETPLVRSAS